MGLDGISINQLRITPEHSSGELNKLARLNKSEKQKIVDGLSNGQKVDPDKENDNNDSESNLNNKNNNDNNTNTESDVVKYELSDFGKFILQIDEETNNILIMDKISQNIVQRIDASELSQFVNYLSDPQGSIINRKF